MLYDLTITDELRERLNNQEELLVEYNKKFGFISYKQYMERNDIETSITTEFLNIFFSQHTFLDDIKDEIIITTSKSSVMTTYGLSGEGNWHIDNILFPIEKENNLIISWNGTGTSCLPQEESDNIFRLKDDFIRENRTDYHNLPSPYTYPIHPIESHYSVDSNEMKILSMKGKTVFHRRNPLNDDDIGAIRYVLNIYY